MCAFRARALCVRVFLPAIPAHRSAPRRATERCAHTLQRARTPAPRCCVTDAVLAVARARWPRAPARGVTKRRLSQARPLYELAPPPPPTPIGSPSQHSRCGALSPCRHGCAAVQDLQAASYGGGHDVSCGGHQVAAACTADASEWSQPARNTLRARPAQRSVASKAGGPATPLSAPGHVARRRAAPARGPHAAAAHAPRQPHAGLLRHGALTAAQRHDQPAACRHRHLWPRSSQPARRRRRHGSHAARRVWSPAGRAPQRPAHACRADGSAAAGAIRHGLGRGRPAAARGRRTRCEAAS